MVKAGDFLAQIDPRPYQAALAQAQGQLAKDTALLAQAQSDLARYQTLSKQDSIAQQQVERPAVPRRAGQGGDRRAIRRRSTPPSSTSPIAASSRRSPAASACAWSTPAITCSRPTRPASSSSPSSIRSASCSRRPRTICRRSPARLNSGAKLPVQAYRPRQRQATRDGELTTFDNQIDTTTGTFKLRATFANPDDALFPNQFVNVRLLVDTLTGAVLVPNAGDPARRRTAASSMS